MQVVVEGAARDIPELATDGRNAAGDTSSRRRALLLGSIAIVLLAAAVVVGAMVVRSGRTESAACPSVTWATTAVDTVTQSLSAAGASDLQVDRTDCESGNTSTIRAHAVHAEVTGRLEDDGWVVQVSSLDGRMTRPVADVRTTVRVVPGKDPDTVVVTIWPTDIGRRGPA